jgi:hypothetical protein
MRMTVIIYGLGLLVGTSVVLITLHYGTTTNATFVAVFLMVIVFGIHMDLIKRKQTRTCPKCGEWWKVEKINRLDSSAILLPTLIGNDISVVYQLRCKRCNHSWDVLTYETRDMS